MGAECKWWELVGQQETAFVCLLLHPTLRAEESMHSADPGRSAPSDMTSSHPLFVGAGFTSEHL